MRNKRFKLGEDVWECPQCKAIVMMGNMCRVCGSSYADVLIPPTKTKEPCKAKSTHFTPIAESEDKLIQSFFYKQKEEE